MRAQELADLAGTTVRTVRYYHHVGLLPVPPVRGAVRDYGLDHLARLLRIRWLAGSGMPLGAVADVLGEMEPGAGGQGLDELTATLTDIDVRIAELARQRERVAALIDRARRGDGISPLPPAVARLYDRIIPLLPTERARQAARNERKVLTILALRGMVPDGVERLVAEFTEEDERDVRTMFIAFGRLSAGPAGQADAAAEVNAAVLRFVDRHRDAVCATLRSIPRGPAGTAMWAVVRRLVMLGYPAPAQRRFLESVPALLDQRPWLRAAWQVSTPGARVLL